VYIIDTRPLIFSFSQRKRSSTPARGRVGEIRKKTNTSVQTKNLNSFLSCNHIIFDMNSPTTRKTNCFVAAIHITYKNFPKSTGLVHSVRCKRYNYIIGKMRFGIFDKRLLNGQYSFFTFLMGKSVTCHHDLTEV
jgi:hypothetical protein